MSQEETKISEIFLSYQGEGPFTGSRQLFVRFYGCNLDCVYCDTFPESYRAFSSGRLLEKILSKGNDYNELVLTGGEPLLAADFLKEFLPLFKKCGLKKVYLETNGTLPDAFDKVADYIDIVAMDMKLPSSTASLKDPWTAHDKFLKRAAASCAELIIKAVITASTDFDDIKRMSRMIAPLEIDATVVLQPVTPLNDSVGEARDEMLSHFRAYVKKETKKDVMVLGQMHKCLGIK